MKKFLFLPALLLTTIICFSGCATATTTSVYFANGSRTSEIAIEIDKTTAEGFGIDVQKALETLLSLGDAQIKYLNEEYNPTAGADLKHGIDPENPNIYYYSMSFDSVEAYRTFYGLTDDDFKNDTPDIRHGLYTSQYVIEDTDAVNEFGLPRPNVYGAAFAVDTLAEAFANALFDGNQETARSFLDKVSLTMIKCYPRHYKYHSNADFTQSLVLPYGTTDERKAMYTAHYWKGTLLTPPENFYVYTTIIDANNRLAWYLTAIGLTIIFGAALAIYLMSRKDSQ